MLIPPDNFGMVEPGFYRCSKLEADHLPFLETLQLKSLILLDVAKPPRTLKSFLHENHVDLYNLGGLKISNHQNTGSSGQETAQDKKDNNSSTQGVFPLDFNGSGPELVSLERDSGGKNDSWMIIEKNLLVAAVEILLDRTKHPVLIVDSSSALVGILRKIQKWNFTSIVNEYRIYTGNASKISYNVEVFLELVQLELVPYEIEHASHHHHHHHRRKDDIPISDSPFSAMSKNFPSVSRRLSSSVSPINYVQAVRSQRNSVDEGNSAVFDDDDTFSLGDYEDDMDDELLSASPQIPATLLRLAEQRKGDVSASPGTSPDFRRPSLAGTRSNSIDISQFAASRHRRQSSVESRYVRASNTRFRDPQYTPVSTSPRRASLDANLKQFRMEQEKSASDELQRLKEKLNYAYYRPMDICADGFNVIKVRIPPEQNLAPWFVAARDFWEKKCKQQSEK